MRRASDRAARVARVAPTRRVVLRTPGRRYSSRDDSNGRVVARRSVCERSRAGRGAGSSARLATRRGGFVARTARGREDASAHHAGVFERPELGAELGEDARVDHGRARAEVVLPLGRLRTCGGWRVGRGMRAKKRRLRRGRRRTCAARGVRGGAADEGPGATGEESAVRAGVSDERARRLTVGGSTTTFGGNGMFPRQRCLTSGCSVSRRARLVGDSQENGGENRRWSDDARARAARRARSRRSIAAGRESIANAGGNPGRDPRPDPRSRRGVLADRRARSTPRRRRSERRGADDLAYCRTYRSVRNRSTLTGRDF